MDFNRAEPTSHATELIFVTPVPANKMEFFFIHSTTRNAPYVHLRLDSILELCRTFPINQNVDLYVKWIHHHGRLKADYTHMGLVPKSYELD